MSSIPLHGPSVAVYNLQDLTLPTNCEHGCGVVQPYPLLTHPLRNKLHSASLEEKIF